MATTQKQIKTRIQQKHDTSANWAKATSFVPLKGEIVVYDDLGRIKVGDGTNTVANLKFVDEHPHPYLPLAGGELDPGAQITLTSSSHLYTLVLGGSSITFMGEGGTVNQGSIQGISDTKGNASYLVPSLKCLNDNYLPLSGGTLTGALTATKFTGDASGLTSIPAGKLTGTISIDRLPNLSSKYLSISGGTLTGQLTLSNNGIKFNTNAIKDVTYSTTDLTAGTSTLATNSIYIVYE